ncbi:LysM peptidoglycan-binding domain-containing protein [Pontimonas sp.]|jgi:Tfp pilus assembly protein FimV|uniref:LysM peptidoglycan-binding domain-containing protein n=1 Tax=Pontimonas sp. TaxID=2304492 RepID=UPI0028701745|nr:LysM peptidoglycan-binding domain-containing protein [Pontimonas sp.]MDR9396586.1 LysM peptidoglycan-binding domain-containing protein [Pontimonas sp.]MDR9435020.1 LysM peptidoglycan-binding domain-containing protein [Pontimonas sp.]
MSHTTTAGPAQLASAPLRITRRGRVVLAGLIALPVLVLSLVFATPGAQAGGEDGTVEVYTVLAGESLWDIAEDIAPQQDPRVVIDRLLRANALDSASLQPGQQLIIPAGL